MSTTIRREYRPLRRLPDTAETLWEADLARIALRREFEGLPTEIEQEWLSRAS
jgi:hypothetical protein